MTLLDTDTLECKLKKRFEDTYYFVPLGNRGEQKSVSFLELS